MGGSGAAIVGATSATGAVSGAVAAWNQLWRHWAQRTVRPAAPIALSGTR